MTLAKPFADLLSVSRALIAVCLMVLGRAAATVLLPVAALLLLASWISDTLDGPLARRGGGQHTWVGDHDLEIDVLVSLGVLTYLVGAGFLAPTYALAYLALWGLSIVRWGWKRDPAMLFQAPIYLWFIIVALREAPEIGRWLVIYPVAAVIVTWPRFPRQVVPDFLAGMAKIMKRQDAGSH